MNKLLITVLFASLLGCSSTEKITNLDPKIENKLSSLKEQIDDREKNGHHYLSPNYFARAHENYREARMLALEGKALEDVQHLITNGHENIESMSRSIELAKVHLPKTLDARSQAIEENAQNNELFKEAEEELLELGYSLEEKDINKVIDERNEALRLYIQSEINAINNRVLMTARINLEKAKKEDGLDHFNSELDKAQKDIQSAETLIERFKDNAERYRQAVEKAENSTERLYVLAEAGSWISSKSTRELVLNLDEKLNEILKIVDYNNPDRLMLNTKIKYIKSEAQRVPYLRSELTDAQVALVESKWKINYISSTKDNLNNELNKIKWSERKLSDIRSLFEKDEAEILVKNDDLIIQLKGLNFGFDKAELPKNSDEILGKVDMTLRKFNYPNIQIIGHADSVGNALYNEKLSKQRAINLGEYLVKNSPLKNHQAEVEGRGFMNPLTENKSQDGRKTNRRIDIVLSSVVE